MHVNQQAPGINGLALEGLIARYRSVQDNIKRLKRRYPMALLDKLIYQNAFNVEDLGNEALAQEWATSVSTSLNSEDLEGTIFTNSVTIAENTDEHKITFTIRKHGIDTDFIFDHRYFSSEGYKAIVNIGKEITDLIEEGAYIQRGDRRKDITSFVEAVQWLMHESKRGLYIQRYKGLGEMNPDQLCDTTMDPNSRHMLQVRIEDAVAADQLFSTLMGDHVEPRRAFIEENALRVENLDV